MSISEKELEESFHTIKEKPDTETGPTFHSEYYTLLGENEAVDSSGQPLLVLLDDSGNLTNEDKCYAKQVNDIYFIKTISGRLFNPVGMYADKKKFQKQAGSYAIKWERVAKNTFDNYLMFLRTKNAAHFLLAERAQTYG